MTDTERLVIAFFVPHALVKLRVGIPWQVRYVRWWWRRQAECERLDGRPDAAARSDEYARAAVGWWRKTGSIPTAIVTEPEAIQRMRCPPRIAARILHASPKPA